MAGARLGLGFPGGRKRGERGRAAGHRGALIHVRQEGGPTSSCRERAPRRHGASAFPVATGKEGRADRRGPHVRVLNFF